jgi:hypothetical protein
MHDPLTECFSCARLSVRLGSTWVAKMQSLPLEGSQSGGTDDLDQTLFCSWGVHS